MARPEFPWAIDRRRLLTSAAAVVTATCIGPGVESADAATPDLLQSTPLRPNNKAGPTNFSAATAQTSMTFS
jgi:hypothetical protein